MYIVLPLTKHILVDDNNTESTDFWHWLCLYHEIARRLNSDIIKKADLPEIEEMIFVWLKLLPIIMHEEEQTFNAHLLSHLNKHVKLFGPVHNYSAFVFE